jgi:hypothetical protein
MAVSPPGGGGGRLPRTASPSVITRRRLGYPARWPRSPTTPSCWSGWGRAGATGRGGGDPRRAASARPPAQDANSGPPVQVTGPDHTPGSGRFGARRPRPRRTSWISQESERPPGHRCAHPGSGGSSRSSSRSTSATCARSHGCRSAAWRRPGAQHRGGWRSPARAPPSRNPPPDTLPVTRKSGPSSAWAAVLPVPPPAPGGPAAPPPPTGRHARTNLKCLTALVTYTPLGRCPPLPAPRPAAGRTGRRRGARRDPPDPPAARPPA